MSAGGAVPAGAATASDTGLREAVDAYQEAVDAATAAELAGDGDAAFCLRLAALEAAIARRAAVRAVISIHRALLAGAAVRELVEVTGVSADQLAEWWTGWADGQVRLREQAGIGVDLEEYDRAAAALAGHARTAADDVTGPGSPVLPRSRM
jgi:hypothetical protein